MLFILYGGELVVAFLVGRIALWMWRSRDVVRALWRDRRGEPPDGPPGPGLPEPIPLQRPTRAAGRRLARAA
jgi:hypothetical protein